MREIYTPFEHQLIGSTVDARYRDKMHTPMAVQDGMPIDECDTLRQLLGGMIVLPGKFGVGRELGVATIPRLDEKGKTTGNPVLYLATGEHIKTRGRANLSWLDGPIVSEHLIYTNN